MLSAESRPASSVSWTHGLVRRQVFPKYSFTLWFSFGRERAGNAERVLLGLGGECRVLVGFRVAVSLCSCHCNFACVKLGFMQPRPESLTQAQCKLRMMLNHLHSGSHEDLKCSVVQDFGFGICGFRCEGSACAGACKLLPRSRVL